MSSKVAWETLSSISGTQETAFYRVYFKHFLVEHFPEPPRTSRAKVPATRLRTWKKVPSETRDPLVWNTVETLNESILLFFFSQQQEQRGALFNYFLETCASKIPAVRWELLAWVWSTNLNPPPPPKKKLLPSPFQENEQIWITETCDEPSIFCWCFTKFSQLILQYMYS